MGHESVVDDKSGKHNHTGKHLRILPGKQKIKDLTTVSEYLEDESVVWWLKVHSRGAFNKNRKLQVKNELLKWIYLE